MTDKNEEIARIICSTTPGIKFARDSYREVLVKNIATALQTVFEIGIAKGNASHQWGWVPVRVAETSDGLEISEADLKTYGLEHDQHYKTRCRNGQYEIYIPILGAKP